MAQCKGTARSTKKDKRVEKRAVLDDAVARLSADWSDTRERQSRAALLKSVTDGLYDELDKLSKKAPVDQATDLVVDHVNELVTDVRALLASDEYVQRIKQFVPAGDNPEHRDVLLVLRQVRQGLDRLTQPLADRVARLNERMALARGLIVALDLYVQYGEPHVTELALKANDVSLPAVWLRGAYGDKTVDLDTIDSFDPATLLEDLP